MSDYNITILTPGDDEKTHIEQKEWCEKTYKNSKISHQIYGHFFWKIKKTTVKTV